MVETSSLLRRRMGLVVVAALLLTTVVGVVRPNPVRAADGDIFVSNLADITSEGSDGQDRFPFVDITRQGLVGIDQPPQSVLVSVEDITATSGEDYVFEPVRVVFEFDPVATLLGDSEQTETLMVQVLADNVREPDETFRIVLSDVRDEPQLGTPAPSTTSQLGISPADVILIRNDDGPQVSVSDAGMVDELGGQATFTISRDVVDVQAVQVGWTTTDGSAVAPEDYVAASGTATIPGGQASTTVTIDVTDDAIQEPLQDFTLDLTSVTDNAFGVDRILDGSGTATIRDNDGEPRFALLDSYETIEGVDRGGATQAQHLPAITVVRLGASQFEEQSVNLFPTPGTATLNVDYQQNFSSYVVRFGPGVDAVEKTSIEVTNDTVSEPHETVNFRLRQRTDQPPIEEGRETSVLTIKNDDAEFRAGTTEPLNDAFSILEGGPRFGIPMTLKHPVVYSSALLADSTNITTVGTADFSTPEHNRRAIFVFEPEQTERFYVVEANDDDEFEGDETFRLDIEVGPGVTQTTIADPDAIITIIDDEPVPPNVSVGDINILEGDDADTTGDVTITLDAPATRDTSVRVDTVDGTATAGEDYTAIAATTVTIPQGDTTATVTLTVTPDELVEGQEEFEVVLSEPDGVAFATTGDARATVAILDNDIVGITISDATVTETDAPVTAAAMVRIQLPAPLQPLQEVSVSYFPQARTAGFNDYERFDNARIARFNFDPAAVIAGVQFIDVPIGIIGDQLVEGTETFGAGILNATANFQPFSPPIADDEGTVTILDDDLPVVSVTSPDDVVEGTTVDVQLTLDQPAFVETQVGVIIRDGTTDRFDLPENQSGTVVFPAGETSVTFQILTTDDDVAEATRETYTIELRDPVGLELGANGTGGILDNDESVAIGFSDFEGPAAQFKRTVQEGNPDATPGSTTTTPMGFYVEVKNPAEAADYQVDWTLVDGTAIAGEDFVADQGTVTVRPGSRVFIGAEVLRDLVPEDNETFEIVLSNPRGPAGQSAPVIDEATARQTGTVLNDDVNIRIEGATVLEGDSGTTTGTATITVDGAHGDVTATVSTEDGTATAPSDYVAIVDEPISIAAAETTTTIDVTVNGDLNGEGQESFDVVLANIVGATALAGDERAAIIIPPDDLDGITIVNAAPRESDDAITQAPVRIFLPEPITNPLEEIDVTIVTVADTSARAATPDEDYVDVPLPGQVVQFSFDPDAIVAGQQFATADIQILPDQLVEGVEIFFVQIVSAISSLNGAQAVADDTAEVRIMDDDSARLSIADAAPVVEGETAIFAVTLDQPQAAGAFIDFELVHVTTSPGDTGEPFAVPANADGRISFPPFATSAELRVEAFDDAIAEASIENFRIVLSGQRNLEVLDGEADGSIIDNDGTSLIGFAPDNGGTDGNVIEGDPGGSDGDVTTITYLVTATPAIEDAGATMDWTLTGDRTDSFQDVVSLTGTLSLSGPGPYELPIGIVRDLNPERHEDFTLTLSNPQSTAGFGELAIDEANDEALMTIRNDDVYIRVGVSSVPEGDSGDTTVATTAITVQGAHDTPVTGVINTEDDTATLADNDYEAVVDQAISIPPSVGDALTSSTTVDVTVIGDDNNEDQEFIALVLTDVDGAELRGPTHDRGRVTIQRDDLDGVVLADASATETDDTNATAEVLVSLAEPVPPRIPGNPTGNRLTVTLGTTPDTAGTDDYIAFDPPLEVVFEFDPTLAPGETQEQLVPVTILPDDLVEGTERFQVVVLDTSANYPGFDPFVQDGIADITIIDDDIPTVSIVDAAPVIEGDTAIFAITQDQPSVGSLPSVGFRLFHVDTEAADLAEGVVTRGRVFLPANGSGGQVRIGTFDDNLVESLEGFRIELEMPANVVIGDGDADGSIQDNDGGVIVGFAADNGGTDGVVIEGDPGGPDGDITPITYVVETDVLLGTSVLVDWTVEGQITTNDFVARSGTLTLDADGATDLVIAVKRDLQPENHEDLQVVLSNARSAGGDVTVSLDEARDTVTGQIRNDDVLLTIGNATIVEGDDENTTGTVSVQVLGERDTDITARVDTADGTATAGADYLAIVDGTVVIQPGVERTPIEVTVVGDNLEEDEETFNVNLSEIVGVNVILDDSGRVTIPRNDQAGLTLDDVTVTEGDPGDDTQALVRVTLIEPLQPGQTVNVSLRTFSRTAQSIKDFVSHTSSPYTVNFSFDPVAFATGEQFEDVPINIVKDLTPELTEFFVVQAAPPTPNFRDADGNFRYAVADGEADVTIEDDDIPSVSIADADPALEGETAVFTVTLDVAGVEDAQVDYSLVDGDTDALDRPAGTTTGTVVFPAGETTATIRIATTEDNRAEPVNEAFTVVLSDPVGLEIADGQGAGVIVDDEGPVRIGAFIELTGPEAGIVLEGDTGTTLLSFFARIVPAPTAQDGGFTADWTLVDDTATAGEDYTAASGTVTVNPGSATSISVDVLTDLVPEEHETLRLVLSNPTAPAGYLSPVIDEATGSAVGTILNDETNVLIDDVIVGEADGTIAVPVRLSHPMGAGAGSVTVDYTEGGGGAPVAGDLNDDFQPIAGSVTFAEGEQTATAFVTIIDDNVDEFDENNSVLLSAVDNPKATIADDTGRFDILDNDATPILSVDQRSYVEDDTAAEQRELTFRLDRLSEKGVTVDYRTEDDTATSGVDYGALDDTLAFGFTDIQTVTIDVTPDDLPEADEVFHLVLENEVNATLATTSVPLTIINNDAFVSIGDASVLEGDSGQTPASLVVRLDRILPVDAALTYTLSPAPGDDLVDLGDGTLLIPAGQTTTTVNLAALGDTVDELDEDTTITIAGTSNLPPSDAEGVFTILDDDGFAFIEPTSTLEGDTGSTLVDVIVRLSEPDPTDPVTIAITTVETSPVSATIGTDVTAFAGDATFAVGETETTIQIEVLGDSDVEPDEVVLLEFTDPNSGQVSRTPLTILNDDATVSLGNVTVVEGDDGTTTGSLQLALSSPLAAPVDLGVDARDPAATATLDEDLTVPTTVTLPAGVTTTTLTVSVIGDLVDELNEVLTLLLVDLDETDGLTIADGTGVVTITDDDATPTIDIAKGEVTEGDDGQVSLTLPVTLSNASDRQIDVTVSATDGTATAGDDFVAPAGTLTIAPLATTGSVVVQVEGDVVDELDETFTVTLTDAVNALVGDGSAVGTILDDDTAVLELVADVSAPEGNEDDETPAVFTARLDGPAPAPVTATVALTGVTATVGDDVSLVTTSITIPTGALEASATVLVLGDTVDEADETATLSLTDVTGADAGVVSRTLTILDDDAVRLSVDDARVTEGEDLVVALRLDQPAAQAVDVDLTAVGVGTNAFVVGTIGDAGVDVAAAPVSIQIPAGVTLFEVTLATADDLVDERDELGELRLSNVVNADVADDTAGLRVDDNDTAVVNIGDAGVVVESAGTLSYAVTLDGPAPDEAVVTYRVDVVSTVTENEDVGTASGSVTFPAGVITATIDVDLVDDDIDEADETLVLRLDQATVVALGDTTGVGVITDDDLPFLSISDDVTISEDGVDTVATFRVSIPRAQTGPVRVQVTTSDGTATAPDDYTSVDELVTIPAGDLFVDVDVPIIGDDVDEPSETVTVTLSAPEAARLGPDTTATLTIVDDDLPILSITDVAVDEGDDGSAVAATLTISIPDAQDDDVSVDVATVNGDAVAGQDFEALDTTVTIPAGLTEITVDVTVTGDDVDELDEAFELLLTNPAGARIELDDRGVITIRDDDTAVLSIADAQVAEGDSGNAVLRFVASLDQPSPTDVEVTFTTGGGNATAGVDYTPVSDQVRTIAAGSTVLVVSVTVIGDLNVEGDETFELAVSSVSGAVSDDTPATGTILDDDSEVDLGEDRQAESAVPVNFVIEAPQGATVTWDFGDGGSATGANVTHRFDTSGTYTVTVSITTGGTTRRDSIQVIVTDGGVVDRNQGEDRIRTAVEASRAHWPDAGRTKSLIPPAGGVILARADLFPDALAGGPLAALLDAPLLLTSSEVLSPLVAEEIKRLGVDQVTILGGLNAINSEVEQSLRDLGVGVTRLAGEDRFTTAALIAGRVGPSPSGDVVLALGQSEVASRAWPDALSAGSLSASPDRLPVLLVRPDALPEVTAAAIKDLGATRALLLGGPVAVNANVEAAVAQVVNVTRLAGEDRYGTSVAVAREALTRFPAGQVDVVFATGANFPDGLAAGAVAARRGAVVLLVPPTGMADDGVTLTFLREFADRFDAGVIIGGPIALPLTVESRLRTAITATTR